jgi:cAMP-dependent protein kinase regulator
LVKKEATDAIIKQGDDADNFYIIDRGEVDIYVNASSGGANEQQLVASYGEGDSFGELAIMYNAPRAASCIARTDVRLWALDRISFKVVAMQTAMSRREVYKGFLMDVPLLSTLSEYEVLTLADALEEQSFEDGTVVCKEGDDGDAFFLVKSGCASCSKEHPTDGMQVEVARLGKGDFFGEVALLTEKKRQATVKASGEDGLRCLSLDRKAFLRCIGPLESVLRRNMEQYPSLQDLLDKRNSL